MLVRTVFALAGIGALVGAAGGLAEIAGQRYLPLGFYRNAWILIGRSIDEGIVAGAIAAALFLLFFAASRLVRRPAFPRLFGLAAVLALGLWVRLGWPLNRYEFAGAWKERADLFGRSVPRALVDGEVILTNAAVTVGALVAGVILYFLFRWIAGRDRSGRIASLLRRAALAVALFAGLLLVAAHAAGPVLFGGRQPAGPNVILLSLDTLRADYLGCYGCPLPTSPAIDRFAGESVLFECAHSQAPYTLPSHASMLTSRYPSVNGASVEGRKLPRWRVLAAEIFREAGYRTGGIVDVAFLTSWYGLEQGYDDYTSIGRRVKNIVPRAIDWLEKRSADEPFFLFLHVYDIHRPYATIDEYRRMFLDFDYQGDLDVAGSDLVRYQREVSFGRDPGFELTDEDGRYLKAIYAGGIRYADDILGDLFDALRAGPLAENTIVVITADHGEEFLEHDIVLHGDLYRTVTWVPLLLRLPGGEMGGTRIDAPVGLIDLLPTLLDLTGIEPPVPLGGRSLVPLIRGEAADLGRPVFSEFDDLGGHLSVLDDEYHLVARLRDDRWELFRYRNDPLEQRDWSGEMPGRVDSMRAAILSWQSELERRIQEESGFGTADEVDLDASLRDELRQLGYIE